MNPNYERCLIETPQEFAFDMLMAASKIINERGLYLGMPAAWVEALMFLRRGVHVPPRGAEAFDSLSNEMCAHLEGRPGGGVRFADYVDEDRLRAIECAYKVLFGAILAARDAYYRTVPKDPFTELMMARFMESMKVETHQLESWDSASRAN